MVNEERSFVYWRVSETLVVMNWNRRWYV